MPRRPEYDRDDLIARALDLFWKQGWAGTSLKDLEHVLKLKPGSFYAAFGSKDALFALTMDRYVQVGRARVASMVEELGPLKTLQEFPLRMISNTRAPAKACMLAKSVLELSGRDHALAAVANAHLETMEKQFAQVFKEAQSAGQIDAGLNPGALARRYQSDLMGLRISAEREGVDARAIAEEISESLSRLAPPE